MSTIFGNKTYFKCKKCSSLFLVPDKELEKATYCTRCNKILNHTDKRKNNNIYAGLRYMTPRLYKGNFKGGIDVSDISGHKFAASNPTLIGGRYD